MKSVAIISLLTTFSFSKKLHSEEDHTHSSPLKFEPVDSVEIYEYSPASILFELDEDKYNLIMFYGYTNTSKLAKEYAQEFFSAVQEKYPIVSLAEYNGGRFRQFPKKLEIYDQMPVFGLFKGTELLETVSFKTDRKETEEEVDLQEV